MEFLSFVFNLFLCVLSCVEAQQPYIGQGTNRCSSTSDSALGYSCNGVNRTCPSYLTFRAQPPYTTVASISTLLGSNSSQLAAINSVPETASFPTNQLVLVPVTCSCSGMMASFAVVGIVICLCFRKRKVKLDPVATSESFETVDKATKKLEDERKDSFLESDFRAKIANLAQARSTEGQDGEFNLTRHIFGTKGYMAPEYLENGMVSTKIDVFAFGVLLLEMITGKEVASLYREGSNGLSNVLEEVVSHAEDGKENNLRQFLDTSMEGNYPIDLAVLILRLVHGCLNKNPANRPAMNELVQSLSRILTASLSWELSNNLSDYRNP
ncbi:Protein LYK5 [Linum perenne]